HAYVLKPDTAGGTGSDQDVWLSCDPFCRKRGAGRGAAAVYGRTMPPLKHRPRGYIEHLPSGSYRVIVPIERDPLTGKRRRLRETCATPDQAKVALTKLQRQVDEGKHPKSAITVREALRLWLEVAKLGVTTREQYDDLIRLYINP